MTNDVAATRTVLLVEDDPHLRWLVARMFERNGFEVIEARNGSDALDKARQRDLPIDLLVTDVVMPHMDGFDLSSEFCRLYPETRVLFVSGQADESVAVRGGLKETGEQYLLKPFTQEELKAKIGELLDHV